MFILKLDNNLHQKSAINDRQFPKSVPQISFISLCTCNAC